MKIEAIEEIIDCLPKGKTLFSYYPERYASMLLAWATDDSTSIAELKQSRLAPLLQRTSIKAIVKQCGDGLFDRSMLDMGWSNQHDSFLLTLDCWDKGLRRHRQTTRSGCNLILQINLDYRYQQALENLFRNEQVFQFHGHPVLKRQRDINFRQTLAWVRMDLELGTNEVLIEEIQSDFIRFAQWYRNYLNFRKDRSSRQQQQLDFCELVLARFHKIWREAVMAAALWFIREELGMSTIWYHTHLTGAKLKKIRGRLPPQSLYSRLPRQFCFEKTTDRPEFLLGEPSFKRDLRRVSDMEFYRLRL